MSLTDTVVDELADRLDEAATTRRPIAAVTKEADLELTDAYRVQAALVRRRLRRGERVVGGKLGLTSRAKQWAMASTSRCTPS
ncbi:hypothetical protein BJF78_22430 [Pseudonocardia sp. CNS-139]|nr:hypothetical protein BJF78_22430 [Pseudonocardia sp. CNS-139]